VKFVDFTNKVLKFYAHNGTAYTEESLPRFEEYLRSKFSTDEALMFMVSESMKVGMMTGHIPLNKVSEQISEDAILKKVRLMNHSLQYDFLIRKPKIAVLGLNPHAGDNSLLGEEESRIIIPSIKKANGCAKSWKRKHALVWVRNSRIRVSIRSWMKTGRSPISPRR